MKTRYLIPVTRSVYGHSLPFSVEGVNRYIDGVDRILPHNLTFTVRGRRNDVARCVLNTSHFDDCYTQLFRPLGRNFWLRNPGLVARFYGGVRQPRTNRA